MSNNCGGIDGLDCNSQYRMILWIVLLINFGMFVLEVLFSITSGSQSLLADSLDFLSDSANYGISIYVLSKTIKFRARATLIKGYSVGIIGIWVLVSTFYKIFYTSIPGAKTMGVVGFIALIANIFSAFLLYKYRKGDSNRASVWICSRNDAIANIAVIFAGLGVWATNTRWPDLLVALIIATISLSGARYIVKKARAELLKSL